MNTATATATANDEAVKAFYKARGEHTERFARQGKAALLAAWTELQERLRRSKRRGGPTLYPVAMLAELDALRCALRKLGIHDPDTAIENDAKWAAWDARSAAQATPQSA